MDIDTILQQARAMRKAHAYHDAILLLTGAVKETADARLFFSRGINFDLMNEREKAVEDLTRAVELDNTNPKYLYERGCILSYPLCRNEEAIADFERVLEMEPEHLEAHRQCCGSWLMVQKPDLALAHAEAALALAPDEALTQFYLAETYISLKRFDEAITALNRAKELDPDGDYSNSLGRAEEGRTAQTRRQAVMDAFDQDHASTLVILAKRWLKDDPGDVQIMLKLADILGRLTRYDEAIAVFQSVRGTMDKRDGAEWPILCNIGNMFRYSGRLPEAESWFRKAIDVAPRQVAPYIFLGSCQARQGKLRAAEESHRAATTIKDSKLLDEAFHNLGLVLRAQDRLPEAAASFRTAIELTPNYEEAIDALADVEQAMGLAHNGSA